MNNNQIQQSNLKPRTFPLLKETEKNYLKFIKPFTHDNKNEAGESEKKLQDLCKKEGVVLQKRLLDQIKLHPSWLYDFALEQKLLLARQPIPILSNYYLLFDFHFKDQVEAVAKIILCSVLLKNIIRSNKLSQITNKCFNQFNLLFHSCRIPCTDKDKLMQYDYGDNNYVIIILNNVYWMLEASLDYDKIRDQVSYITSMNFTEKSENYIGILSSGERNKWAQNKEKLVKVSHKNRELLYYLDRSMLVFSLEEKASTDLLLRDINNLCWYGDGQNKYFDKLMQLIVLKDGFVAMNTQRHSIDLSVSIEFAKLIYEWSKNKNIQCTTKNEPTPVDYFENFAFKPTKLSYEVDKEIKKAIREQHQELNLIQQDFTSDFIFFNEYGRTTFERKRIVPAAFIQLAVLAAYYRTFSKIVPSRQFVCGRNFSYGFEEWIRTTTKESANFSVAINEMRVPRDLKIKIGLDAFKQHRNNSMEVNTGKSIDTHFLGLSSVIKSDEKTHAFFEDEMFVKSSSFVIDTYQIMSDFVKLSANPPPSHDGISITYILRKDNIQFVGTAYHDLQKYFQSLIEILREMKDLFIEKERDFYIRPKF